MPVKFILPIHGRREGAARPQGISRGWLIARVHPALLIRLEYHLYTNLAGRIANTALQVFCAKRKAQGAF